jgi:hypothetical protein
MDGEQKQRIVIELREDDYKAAIAVKTLLGVSWRDVLIAGCIWWVNELNLEERLEQIRSKVKELTEIKNN